MLGERADFEFRCFNNVNRFRNPENTLSPHSADAPTSNSGKHPYHIEHASSPVHAVFASPTLRRGGHFTFPQRGLPRLDHRICANVRSPPSVCASRAGLAVSHFLCLGGGARNLVCLPRRTRSPVRFRFGCSTSMLGVLPHIFSRFPAPPRSLRCAGRECPCAPPVCLEDGPRASPRAVQPEYLSGMGRRTSPRGSSSRTSIQSSHAESSRFV